MSQREPQGPPRQPRQPGSSRAPQPPNMQSPHMQPAQPAPPVSARMRAKAEGSTRLNQALAQARAWARPASTGTRMLAFAIDLIAVVVVAVIVWLVTESALLGGLAVLEAAVVLAILDARTGATLGNWAMRIRTVRDDSPYSPGIARGAVRALITGAGCVFALVGGFIVVVTSAADPMRMGRSWADRAARTLVVRIPTRAERAAWEQGAEAWAANTLAAPAAPVATAVPVTPIAPGATPAPHVVQASYAAQQPSHVPVDARQLRPAPVPQQEHDGRNAGTTPPGADLPAGVVAVEAPVAAPQPVRQVIVGEQILLTFDTGQRVQLPLPLALNLGRKPDPTEADDQLCIVTDPDSSVSKTHLRLESRGESVWLTDLGSTNGSAMLDDTGEAMPLTAGSRVRLEDGYRVKLGNRSFTVATVVGEMQA